MDNSVMDNASDTNQSPLQQAVEVTEKMIPQSQVNEIVGNAKREAAERAVEAFKRQQQPVPPIQQNQQAYESSNARMSADDIKRLTGDEIKKHFTELEQQAMERANAEAANRIVGMFRDKIATGKERYDDFESVTSNVAMQYYPNVVQLLAEHVDNSGDVLYHLAKNRTKLYEIEATCSHNASDAIYEIKRLSDSIKANDNAQHVKHPNAPLSQQRPSNTGTDSGVLSIADLKRKYRA